MILILILGIVLLSCENKKEEKPQQNIVELPEEKGEIKNGRYGNIKVGYVTKPENWYRFHDKNSSENAVQLSLTPMDIVTLDIVSTNNEATAEQLRDDTYQGHIDELGTPKESLIKSDGEINGFKSKQLIIKIPDGRELTMNLIDYEGKVYYISLEGMPDKKSELEKVVNTWKPNE